MVATRSSRSNSADSPTAPDTPAARGVLSSAGAARSASRRTTRRSLPVVMVVIESTPSSPQHPHSREISSEEDGGDEQSGDEDELSLSNAILAKKSRTEKTETEDIDIEKHQSAYEIERARRLEENKKQLLALGIFKEPTLIPAPVKPRYIEKKHKVARAAEDIPRRQSSRLAGKQEEHTGLKYRDRNYDNDDRNLFFESSEEFSDSGSEREFDSDGNPIIIKRVKNVPRSSNKGKSGNRAKFEKGGRIYDSVNGTSCHQCRQKTLDPKVKCTNEIIYLKDDGAETRVPCTVMMDSLCLEGRYGQNVEEERAKGNWICPNFKGVEAFAIVHFAWPKEKGYKSVSEMLAAEGRLVPKAKVSSKKVDQDSSGKNAKENMVVVA
ncbi:Cell division cycle-associated 7-like protein [Entophlyctis sp. JEL0112]|nr:Cell division cycle-associated 7-like protein [Entophlyctis sp. JEL0112]